MKTALKIDSGRAVAKGCIRFFSATFLSLLPPLLLLLFTRFSALLHRTWAPNYENFSPVTVFLHTRTILVLGFLVSAAAVAAVAKSCGGDRCAWFASGRRRLSGAAVVVSSMHVCLSLWIHGVEDWISSDRGGYLFSLRSLVSALGLHGVVVSWRQKVVKPVVDEAFSEEGIGWVEEVVLAAVFGCLWWRRLRREMEEMVVVRGGLEVVDVVGWLLYGLTAAVGGVRVVKGLLMVANGSCCRSKEVEDEAAVEGTSMHGSLV